MEAELTHFTAAPREEAAAPPFRSGLRLPTLLAVAALHIGVISGLSYMLPSRPAPPAPAEVSIPVVFAPAPAEPPPPELAPSSLQMAARTEPASLAPLLPMTLPPSQAGALPPAPPRKPRHDQSRAALVPPAQDVARPAPPASAPPAPQPATPAPATQHELASWEARIRQAVQDAAIYPQSARLLHREGRAQIRFDYDQGSITLVSIAQSSHVGALDNAALAAVTRAAIPAPPAALGPQKRTLLVWVQFSLVAEE